MSQKKVDSYKAGKNNRSRAARKEKLIDRLEILAWVAIRVFMVAWIGFSAYNYHQENKPVKTTSINLDSIQNFIKNNCQ